MWLDAKWGKNHDLGRFQASDRDVVATREPLEVMSWGRPAPRANLVLLVSVFILASKSGGISPPQISDLGRKVSFISKKLSLARRRRKILRFFVSKFNFLSFLEHFRWNFQDFPESYPESGGDSLKIRGGIFPPCPPPGEGEMTTLVIPNPDPGRRPAFSTGTVDLKMLISNNNNK